MATFLRTSAMLLLMSVSLTVLAAHDDERYPEPVYDNGEYEYAKVVDVQAVTEIVRIPQDQQVCREVPVRRRVVEHRSPAPAIFGAILGGVIGNQLSRGHGHHGHGRRHGHHNNRAAATFAGAAIGGVIATEAQYRRYPPRYSYPLLLNHIAYTQVWCVLPVPHL